MGSVFDLFQGVNKGFWAGGAGAPVDTLTLALNALIAGGGYAGHKMGLLNTPPGLIEKPVGGSEWIAEKMRSGGLLNDNPGSTADNFGNVIGGLLGPVTAAKAPQIARGLLQAEANAAIPSQMAHQGQRGMALFDTSGLPNKGKELIQSEAEKLAERLKQHGFQADIQHSGSAAGPSSYIKVFDPQTSRFLNQDIRLSGHSKGVFNSGSVINVATPSEFDDVLNSALKMREMGPSQALLSQQNIDARAKELISQGIKPKTAYKIAQSESVK